MFIKILSVLMIISGVMILFLSIKEYDKNAMNKYKKIKFFLDIIMSVFYIVTGTLSLCKDIPGEYIVFPILIFGILNIVINCKIEIK